MIDDSQSHRSQSHLMQLLAPLDHLVNGVLEPLDAVVVQSQLLLVEGNFLPAGSGNVLVPTHFLRPVVHLRCNLGKRNMLVSST